MIDWLLMALSIGGALLNVRRYKEGFLVWILANTGWSIVAAYNGLWSQIPMWTVYSIISAWGYREWNRKVYQGAMHSGLQEESR